MTNDLHADEGRHFITVWVTGDHRSGTPRVTEPDKFRDLRWATIDDLPQPLFLPWHNLFASPFLEPLRRRLGAPAGLFTLRPAATALTRLSVETPCFCASAPSVVPPCSAVPT